VTEMAVDVYAAYRSVLACEATRPPVEWTFKSSPAYQQILEHVTPEQGLAYLALAQSSPRWSANMRLLVGEIALENDRLGKPVRAPFDSLGIYCSPTNMRYLWHALEILSWVDHLGLKAVNIVEIGGGYGGLALYLHRLAPYLHSEIASYTILDLPEASALQAAYARELGFPVEGRGDQVFELRERVNFLISAYAFSEFSPEVRAWYEKFVVPWCPHGWMLWNMIPVYPFTDHVYEVADEQPLTGAGNKVVRW
jgi:hypothetical protein